MPIRTNYKYIAVVLKMVSANLDLTKKGTEQRIQIVCAFLRAHNIAFDIVKIDIPGIPYRHEFKFDDDLTQNDSLIDLIKNMPHEWVKKKEKDSKVKT